MLEEAFMKLCDQFVEIRITSKIKEIAIYHAKRRTKEIVRQFVPANAPLVHLESNYVGVIGELAVRKFLGQSVDIPDDYDDHEIDPGDIVINSKVYDVKTDAIPSTYYTKLYTGEIKDYEKYGCRVFTAKHLHHLIKYTGGLIFCAFDIPDDAKKTKKQGKVRNIIKNNDSILIIGWIAQNKVYDKKPTWFTPENPATGHKSKYNSLNYIFHYSKLRSIKDIK